MDLRLQIKSLKAAICRLPNGRAKLQFNLANPKSTATYSIKNGERGDLVNVKLPNEGDTHTLTITQCCIVKDTAKLYADGILVPEKVSNTDSISIQYYNTKIVITKDNPFEENVTWTLTYEHYY